MDLQISYHLAERNKAVEIYLQGMAAEPLAQEWRQLCREIRKRVLRSLVQTNYLRDIRPALMSDGQNAQVLRYLFAPPVSQDTLALILPSYRKSAEKGGKFTGEEADAFIGEFHSRRDPVLTSWLDTNQNPSRRQVWRVLQALTSMISSQTFSTVRRNRISAEQEAAVAGLLESKGWKKIKVKNVDVPSDLPPHHYNRKSRFRVGNGKRKEVDIGCSVNPTLLLALECKVTNDATNSIKRMNDVVDKSKAWKEGWGKLIQTGALLQGVIDMKDVSVLLNNGILVFWSHDLNILGDWLDANSQ